MLHKCLALTLALALLTCLASPALGDMRFDFGTDTSPVDQGHIRVTGDTAYSPEAEFGWETRGQRGFDTTVPPEDTTKYGNPISRPALYDHIATPLRRDGVESENDMTFRIDLPNGNYRVWVTMGNLIEPLESLWLDCNGINVARDLSVKHIVARGTPYSWGYFRVVRFTADVTEGVLRLKFYGNDEEHRKDKARFDKLFPTDENGKPLYEKISYRRTPWDPERPLEFDPKGPFKRNSVLGVVVMPHAPQPFVWDGARLRRGETQWPQADRFLDAFNAGDFSLAEGILERPSAKASPIDLAAGYLCLLGHPETREPEEGPWLNQAHRLLVAADDGPLTQEYLEDLAFFEEARHRFMNRGRRGEGQLPASGKSVLREGHFPENKKVMNLMPLVGSESPLYYKARQYAARALMMLDPHRWVVHSGGGQAIWKELIEVWPENKYAVFYLQNKWSPDDEWHHGDYTSGTEGAPDWAVAVREAYCLLLDMTDWWALNKQAPDGSIGGGWGDDVEIVGFFGVIAFVIEDAAPATLAMAEKLIDGMWNHSELDPDAGFCRGPADAEHSAEWSGDTLGTMLQIRYGNPIWIERAMKTAKLMRNLWMGRTELGHFHFRSNILGAFNIGSGPQANDSYINFRATLPAAAVYRYNQSPTIGKLFVDWADAWVADAMRTDRGKPRGVFPAEVGFPGDVIGGVDGPNWYTSNHTPGTVNYDFSNLMYRGYLAQLITMAYRMTGDEKYLEPLRIEAELARKYVDNPVPDPQPGSLEWIGKILAAGGKQKYSAISTWNSIQGGRELGGRGPAQSSGSIRTADQVAAGARNVSGRVKLWWPIMTTETSATDRVIFPGIGTPYFVMSGGGAVTYTGLGRDATVYLPFADKERLKTVFYNFKSEPIKAAVIPWRLDLGGTYEVVSGIDTDQDGEVDSDEETRSFVLDRYGKRLQVALAPKQTTIVEFTRTQLGRGGRLLADLAIVSDEIIYHPDERQLEVTVHNVGSAPAEDFDVVFFSVPPAGEKQEIGRAKISYLAWPSDFEPKTMRVGMQFSLQSQTDRIRVEVDPDDRIEEITPTNNVAERELRRDPEEVREEETTTAPARASGGRRGR